MWIGGHSYTLACADGEEDMLRQLGNLVDDQVLAARNVAPGLTEIRQLLFAAIYLADKLTAAEQRASLAEAAAQEADTLLDTATSRIERLTGQVAALCPVASEDSGAS